MALEVLRRLRVRDTMLPLEGVRQRMVDPGTSFEELVSRFSESGGGAFPIVKEGRLRGLVTDAQLRLALADRDALAQLLVAQDLSITPITVSERDTLDVAVRRMMRHHLGELVVVNERNPDEPVGLISRAQVVAAYDGEILEAERLL
jgi:CBS domain-containing protein